MLDRLKRAARRLTEREARATPGYRKAKRAHESRPEAARRRDEAETAERVTTDADEYAEDPGAADYPHVDTGPDYEHGGRPGEGPLRTLDRLGTVAPVEGNPSLDPANGLWEVAYMAGYSDREHTPGHGALQGVDRLVTGEADANRELRVESATEGGPMQLGPDESIFADDRGAGTHGAGGGEPPRDWTAFL